MADGIKGQQKRSAFIVNGILILICIAWLLPTLGVFVTSFRQSQDIFNSGWWAVLPHKEDVDFDEIINRIKNFDTRGIAKEKKQSFNDLFWERQLLYKKHAAITLDCKDLGLEELAAQIAQKMKTRQ